MPDIDVDLARQLTPGCDAVLHLNHAGASLMPQPVLDTVIEHLHLEATTGGYEAADEVAPARERVYDAIGRLIGAEAGEIALVDSATRAWNLAVLSFPLGPGDRVLTTRAEYGGNAIALLHLRDRTGCEVVLVEDDADGQVDLDALERELAHHRTRLMSAVHVPTQGGLVSPVAEIGRRCRDAGVPFVLDGCQSVGQLAVDVDAIGCDILSATGRKFLRGPRGTGFLYVRSSFLERLDPVMIDLRSATWTAPDRYELTPSTRRLETFEASVAGQLGLGAAVEHALGWGIDAIDRRVRALAAGLRDRLWSIAGVTVHDKGVERGAIVTFTVDGVAAADVWSRLRDQHTNTVVSTPTFAQFDLPHRGLDALVRASVHYVTTDTELDTFSDQVARIAASSSGDGRGA